MWDVLCAELHAVYGIDLALPLERDSHWLLARIRRLVIDPRSLIFRMTWRGGER